MQTCGHLNQLMSQVLQTQIPQILILQSQILSMFTLNSEGSPDAQAACHRLYCLCKGHILEKNDFEIGFYSTAQAVLKLMVASVFSSFCDHIYISKPRWFPLYIFFPLHVL